MTPPKRERRSARSARAPARSDTVDAAAPAPERARVPERGFGSDRARHHDDAPVRLLADRLRRDVRVFPERDVDPASLEGRHRLQLEHLARLDHALGGTGREVAQLAFAAAAVVLDVHEHTRPGIHLARQHQVDEVLQRREAFTLAADQGAQRLLLVPFAHHVEATGLARVHFDADVEPEVPHQLLEDLLAGLEGLRRRLRGLEIRAFRGKRSARCVDLLDLAGGQVQAATGAGAFASRTGTTGGHRPTVTATGPLASLAATTLATTATLGPGSAFRARPAILPGPALSLLTGTGSAVPAPERALGALLLDRQDGSLCHRTSIAESLFAARTTVLRPRAAVAEPALAGRGAFAPGTAVTVATEAALAALFRARTTVAKPALAARATVAVTVTAEPALATRRGREGLGRGGLALRRGTAPG